MKRLTKENIEKINEQIKDKYDQGIFIQPNYIPTDIKGPVCFIRWNSEGRGGSCWDDEDTINETYYNSRPEFEALNLALLEIGVNSTQKEYIEHNFIEDIDDAGSYNGWYGDYDEYKVNWIELEKIYKYLKI